MHQSYILLVMLFQKNSSLHIMKILSLSRTKSDDNWKLFQLYLKYNSIKYAQEALISKRLKVVPVSDLPGSVQQ